MISRSLLGVSALMILVSAFAACGLSTGGIAPDTTGAGGASGNTTSTATGLGGNLSAATTTSGTTSTGSGPIQEDCFDGKDDNNDKDHKIDCADPTCSSKAMCLDIPMDWTPLRSMKQVQDPNAMPGKCPDGSTETLLFTDPAQSPTCTGCTCNLDPMAACSAPEITCSYLSSNCGASDYVGQATNTSCVQLSPPANAFTGSCKLTADGKVTKDMCVTGGNPATSDPMWKGAVLACKDTSGGCAKGQICAPSAPSDPLCIMRDGTDACPSGWTATSIPAFKSGKDNRHCACSCKLKCEGGEYVVHNDSDCTDFDTAYYAPVTINGAIGSCTAAVGHFDNKKASLTPTLATAKVDTCTDVGSGQVDGQMPVQICCK